MWIRLRKVKAILLLQDLLLDKPYSISIKPVWCHLLKPTIFILGLNGHFIPRSSMKHSETLCKSTGWPPFLLQNKKKQSLKAL